MIISISTVKKKTALAEAAKVTRESITESNIEVFGVMWQVGTVDRDKIRSAIATADLLGENAPGSIGWILADNTVRETTLLDLKYVMLAHALRMDDVFKAYTIWRSGNKSHPFQM